MKVSFSRSAVEDLQNIQEYYSSLDVPHIGDRFVREIVEHVEALLDHPDIGRVVPEFGDQSIRELIHSPFRIVYFREPKSTSVIRIWRSERLLKLPDEKV